MRADVVIMMAPLLKNNLRFFERIKYFTILEAHRAIEGRVLERE